MNLSVNSNIAETIAALKTRINGNTFWHTRLSALEQSGHDENAPKIHLAVFVEPYLQYVFDGTKTIESRFSVNRCAPFERANEGDIVLLKKSGGGVIGVCLITYIWYYNLDESAWKIIRDRFAAPLAIKDKGFWKRKQRACYASLFKISHVVQFEPLPVEKRDRRGWVVLKHGAERQTLLFSA